MALGRPLKLTDTVIQKLCDARAIGSSLKVCAAYAGISVDTLHDWIVRAEAVEQEVLNGRPRDTLTDKERIFLRFLRAWRKSEANATITWQQVVYEASEMEPKWAAWMLQNYDPDGYGFRKKVDITTKGEALVRTEELSDEQLLAIITANEEDGGPGTPEKEKG